MRWPWKRRALRWEERTFWVLDLETGGLDPERDAILSVGMVPIRGGGVRVGEGWYSLVRPHAPVSEESCRIHHILPSELSGAPHLTEILPEVDRRLSEGVLVVHHAGMDLPFLRHAHAGVGHRWPDVPVVDTARLLQRFARRRRLYDPDPVEISLSLSGARAQLGLPAYPSHHALSDALATAELFLVLAHRLGARSLRDLR